MNPERLLAARTLLQLGGVVMASCALFLGHRLFATGVPGTWILAAVVPMILLAAVVFFTGRTIAS